MRLFIGAWTCLPPEEFHPSQRWTETCVLLFISYAITTASFSVQYLLCMPLLLGRCSCSWEGRGLEARDIKHEYNFLLLRSHPCFYCLTFAFYTVIGVSDLNQSMHSLNRTAVETVASRNRLLVRSQKFLTSNFMSTTNSYICQHLFSRSIRISKLVEQLISIPLLLQVHVHSPSAPLMISSHAS